MRESLSLEERFESLKAGLISGGMAAIAEGLFQSLQVYVWPKLEPAEILELLFATTFWADFAIAGLSGFLFGVTCRYAIRQDNNPHLSSGVVLAFGLVRGLAQVRLDEVTVQDVSLVLFAILESIVLFAIAYVGLSISIRKGWVKSLC
jgi:small basic protein